MGRHSWLGDHVGIESYERSVRLAKVARYAPRYRKREPCIPQLFLAIAAVAFVPNTTVAAVKRIEFIPQSLRGSWEPAAESCEEAAKSMITVSATTYTSSEANCKVVWVSETPA